MKFSYKWLKKLSGTKKSPKDLGRMVALKGFELEGIESIKERFDKIIVGKVVSVGRHPNADRLQLAKVDVGGKQIKKIVCGARNIKAGDKVPVALPGAVLPLGNVEIKKTKIRGIVSDGMLCAEDELGLGKDHKGIMILDSKFEAGQPLHKALSIDDHVLEFDVLPNRAHDCLSHEGMAREIAAMEHRKIKNQKSKIKIANKNKDNKTKQLNVEIEDKKLCPRYIGAVLEDVKVGSSPRWMQNRLVACGMEPINNVVDITNYVMLETGSPLHCFDFEKIKTEFPISNSQFPNKSKIKNSNNQKTIVVVRKAREGEQLELLDGTKLELNENDLVIANEKKALALAGIKGGKDSGISGETTQIVLEAANFDPFSIRRSRQRHALLTESQARFEKGISPGLAKQSSARAVELLARHANAKLVETEDAGYFNDKPRIQSLELDYVTRLLGQEFFPEDIAKILDNLGFEARLSSKEKIEVKVPCWRLDIEGPEDLIEEIGRIAGYEKIKEEPIVSEVSIPASNESRKFEWRLKELLAGLGLNETKNYSFYGPRDVKVCGIKKEHFEIENPPSSELSLMRMSMVPGLLKNVSFNQKYFDEVQIFELGRTYSKKEKLVLGGAVSDKKIRSEELFYHVKGVIEGLARHLFGEQVVLERTNNTEIAAYHPAKCASVSIRGNKVGIIGEIDLAILREYGIKDRVVVFELNFDSLHKLAKTKREYQPLRKYPAVLRDISIYVPCKTEARTVAETIQKAGGKLLLETDLFDAYADKPKNKKSLAYHLTFGSSDRTLESGEVDGVISKITKALGKKGIQIRKSGNK